MESEQDKFIVDNMGLVKFLAKKYFKFSSPEEFEDVTQEGYFGLIKAANKFDSSRGIAFSTYASLVIIGTMKRYYRDNAIVKISRGTKSCMTQIRAIMSDLGLEIDEIGMDDIAHLKFTETEKAEALQCIALNTMITPIITSEEAEDSGYPILQLSDNSMNTMKQATDNVFLDSIMEHIYSLYTGISQEILEDYFLAMRYESIEYTQTQLAKRYGLSQCHISRILVKFKKDMANLYGAEMQAE